MSGLRPRVDGGGGASSFGGVLLKGFVVLPRRRKVERTFGWIMKSRRNVRDDERLPQHSEAHLTWALITLMTRRITRKGPHAEWSKKP